MGNSVHSQGRRALASLSTFMEGDKPSEERNSKTPIDAVLSFLLEETGALGAGLSAAQRSHLEALRKERDEGAFFRGLLDFAGILERDGKSDSACVVYTAIVDAVREGVIRKEAESRLGAVQGSGAFAPRFEFLLKRLVKDATNPATILPMMAGSMAFGLVRGAALSRLASVAKCGFFTRGMGARFAAASAGFSVEVPTFALSSRAMRHASSEAGLGPESTVEQDLAGAAITLGLLKSLSFLGQIGFQKLHGMRADGVVTRLRGWVPASHFVFTQGAMFTGLTAAHKAEERLGLRPRVDGGTFAIDTLASMVSLGIGAHLGHRALGEGFARWNRELNHHAKEMERKLDRPRRLSWARNPLLSPLWAAMGNGAPGGLFSGGHGGREILPGPQARQKSFNYNGGSFSLEFRANGEAGIREQAQQSLQDALLDILVSGEEEGVQLAGPIASRLRRESALRNTALGVFSRVSVVFDADQRSILEMRVWQDGELKLELTDPAALSQTASNASSQAPAEPSTRIEPEVPAARLTQEAGGNPAVALAEASTTRPGSVPPPVEREPSRESSETSASASTIPVEADIASSEFFPPEDARFLAIPDKRGYRQALHGQILHFRGMGGDGWSLVAQRGLELVEAIFSRHGKDPRFDATRAAAILYLFLFKLPERATPAKVLNFFQKMHAGVDGHLTLSEVEGVRRNWGELGGPPSGRQDTASIPSKPNRDPYLDALGGWKFLATERPHWRTTLELFEALRQRVGPQSEEYLADMMARALDLAKERSAMTPPRLEPWLRAFHEALDGKMSWEAFDRFDVEGLLLSVGQNTAEPAGEGSPPEGPGAARSSETTKSRAGSRVRSALGLTPIQQALFDVVAAAGEPMLGADIGRTVRKDASVQMSTRGLYEGLKRLVEKGLLQSRREPSPYEGFPDLRYFWLAAGGKSSEPMPSPAQTSGEGLESQAPIAATSGEKPLEVDLSASAKGALQFPEVSKPFDGGETLLSLPGAKSAMENGRGESMTVGSDFRPAERDSANADPAAEMAGESDLPVAEIAKAVSPPAFEIPSPPLEVGGVFPAKSGQEIQTKRVVAPKLGERSGLMGLGTCFRFFTLLNSVGKGLRRMTGNLILPNLDRLSFTVDADSAGKLRLSDEGMGVLVDAREGKARPLRFEKVEGYGSRLRLPSGQGIPSFEFDLSGVRDRSGNLVRLELAPNQPKGPEDLRPFFRAPPMRPLEVIFSEQVSFMSHRGKGGIQQRIQIYLSNGDFIETVVDTTHHGKGSYEVKEAYLHRLGHEPDEAFPLKVVFGASGRGGANRVAFAHEDLGFAVELECEVPSNGGGGVVQFRPLRVLRSPKPVHLTLPPREAGEAADKGREPIAPIEEVDKSEDGEVSGGDHRQSEPRPGFLGAVRSEADRLIEGLAVEVLAGRISALRELGEQALTHANALREIQELCELALDPQAKLADFGGLPPEKILEEAKGLLSVVAHYRPESLDVLFQLHRAGVQGVLDEVLDYAKSENSRVEDALRFVAERSAEGDFEAILGLARLTKEAGSEASRALAEKLFSGQDLDDPGQVRTLERLIEIARSRPEAEEILESYASGARAAEAGKHLDSLISRALQEGPVGETTRRRLFSLAGADHSLFLRLLSLGKSGKSFVAVPAGSILRPFFAHFELREDVAYTREDLRILSEVFGNSQAAQRLVPPQPAPSPAEAMPRGERENPVKSKAAKPEAKAARVVSSGSAQVERLFHEALRANMKRLQTRHYYSLFREKTLELTMAERLASAKHHAGLFEKALKSGNIRAIYANLDLLHALSHRLSEAGHKELVERLRPLARRAESQRAIAEDFACMMRWNPLPEKNSPERVLAGLRVYHSSEDLKLCEDLINLMRKAPAADLTRYRDRLGGLLDSLNAEEAEALARALIPYAKETAKLLKEDGSADQVLLRDREVADFVFGRLAEKIPPILANQIEALKEIE